MYPPQTFLENLFLSWSGPESRFSDDPRVTFLGKFLNRRGNLRAFSNQGKNQILRRKMFLDNLLCDGRGDRVYTCFQFINFPVVQAVKFVNGDYLRELPGGFNGGRELSFDVTLRGCQFVGGKALLMQFLQNLQRHIDGLRGTFVFCVAINPEWAGNLARVEFRQGPVSEAGFDAQGFIQ